MTTYYYIDSYGSKRGPCDEQRFQELTANGSIKPTWLVETDNGHRGLAKEFPDFREYDFRTMYLPFLHLYIFLIGVVLSGIGLARVFLRKANFEEEVRLMIDANYVVEMLFQRALSDPFLIIGVVGIIAGAILAFMPFKQR